MIRASFEKLSLKRLFPRAKLVDADEFSFDEEYMGGLYHTEQAIDGCEFGFGKKTGERLVFVNIVILGHCIAESINGNKVLAELGVPPLLGSVDESQMACFGTEARMQNTPRGSVKKWVGPFGGLHFFVSRFGDEPISLVRINDAELLKQNILDSDFPAEDVWGLLNDEDE